MCDASIRKHRAKRCGMVDEASHCCAAVQESVLLLLYKDGKFLENYSTYYSFLFSLITAGCVVLRC